MTGHLTAELGRRLDARASERTRAWWSGYLKGAIEFRGVPMAGVREVAHELWRGSPTAFVAEPGALLSTEARRMATAKIEGRGRR